MTEFLSNSKITALDKIKCIITMRFWGMGEENYREKWEKSWEYKEVAILINLMVK